MMWAWFLLSVPLWVDDMRYDTCGTHREKTLSRCIHITPRIRALLLRLLDGWWLCKDDKPGRDTGPKSWWNNYPCYSRTQSLHHLFEGDRFLVPVVREDIWSIFHCVNYNLSASHQVKSLNYLCHNFLRFAIKKLLALSFLIISKCLSNCQNFHIVFSRNKILYHLV